MSWNTQFSLGRPGYEYSFEVNPEAINIEEKPIAVFNRTLDGCLKKSVLRSSAPVIRINSNYMTKAYRDIFASFPMIQDTFLSFKTRNDWQVIAEYVIPVSTTQIILPKNSMTKLSQVLAEGGFDGIITINSVSTVPNPSAGETFGGGGFGEGGFAGPDYFSGGSYDDETRTVTVGSPLPSATEPVYVTYTYEGWLVNMDSMNHLNRGGWQDKFSYDIRLIGV